MAQTFENVTLYLKSDMFGNIHRIDASFVVIDEGLRYAQYSNATRVDFIPKGKRKPRGVWVTSYPFIIVLRREDAINPDDMYGDAEVRNGVSVRQSRYSCFDDRYVTDFQAQLEATGVTPLYQRISNEREW